MDNKEQIERLEKRVKHLESELDLLKELVKLQNKAQERCIPLYPSQPIQPFYDDRVLPNFKPPYRFTCGGGEE